MTKRRPRWEPGCNWLHHSVDKIQSWKKEEEPHWGGMRNPRKISREMPGYRLAGHRLCQVLKRTWKNTQKWRRPAFRPLGVLKRIWAPPQHNRRRWPSSSWKISRRCRPTPRLACIRGSDQDSYGHWLELPRQMRSMTGSHKEPRPVSRPVLDPGNIFPKTLPREKPRWNSLIQKGTTTTAR